MGVYGLLAWYAAGRVLFTLIEDTHIRLWRHELLWALVFFCVASAWLAWSNGPYVGLVVGGLFVGTSLLPRYYVRKEDVRRTGSSWAWVGIVEFAWLAILGVACGAIVFSLGFDVTRASSVLSGQAPAYYTQMSAELEFLLGKSVDVPVVLGSVLAVCMTILWSRAIWLADDPKTKQKHYRSIRSAAAMVTAYFVVVLTILFYVSRPLFLNYNDLGHLVQTSQTRRAHPEDSQQLHKEPLGVDDEELERPN